MRKCGQCDYPVNSLTAILRKSLAQNQPSLSLLLRCVNWKTSPRYIQLLLTSLETFPFRIYDVACLISVITLSQRSANPIIICADNAMFNVQRFFQKAIFRNQTTEK